jgi:hypothetical protein
MDEFLAYFRAAIERPESVPPWSKWWPANRNRVEQAFDNADFELLRTGKLNAARMILRRPGLAWPSHVRVIPTWGARSLSEENLAGYERGRSISIPDDFRQFLLAYNGGHIQPGWFRCSEAQADPQAERLIVGFSWFTSLQGINGSTQLNPQFEFPHLADDFLPVARLNAVGSFCVGDDILLLGVRGEERGGIWFWPADRKGFKRTGLFQVASSFTELMHGLDYPAQAKPWMEQIDQGDVAGFLQWMEAGGDIRERDRASGTTPIEYAALAREFNLFLGQAWQNEEGKRRKMVRWKIAKLLLERGVEPGHTLIYALSARNIEIAKAVPLDRTGTGDLREAWDRLREGPAADSQFRAIVEKELEARKRKQCEETSAPSPPVPDQTGISASGQEALAWLRTSDNESALASNRFADTQTAIRFVEQLYAAGAQRILIPEDSIQDDGDQLLYADALIVVLPPELSKRQALFHVCDREWAGRDADLPAAEDQDSIFLWWD